MTDYGTRAGRYLAGSHHAVTCPDCGGSVDALVAYCLRCDRDCTRELESDARARRAASDHRVEVMRRKAMVSP